MNSSNSLSKFASDWIVKSRFLLATIPYFTAAGPPYTKRNKLASRILNQQQYYHHCEVFYFAEFKGDYFVADLKEQVSADVYGLLYSKVICDLPPLDYSGKIRFEPCLRPKENKESIYTKSGCLVVPSLKK